MFSLIPLFDERSEVGFKEGIECPHCSLVYVVMFGYTYLVR